MRFFQEIVHNVCEGLLYAFLLRISQNGVKNAVERFVDAGKDDFCNTRSKQITVVRKMMRSCALRGMLLTFLTGKDGFVSESHRRTALRGG